MSATTPDITAVLPGEGYTPDTNAVIEISTQETITVGLDVSKQLDLGTAFEYFVQPNTVSPLTQPINYTATLTSGAGVAVTLPSAPYLDIYTIVQAIPGNLLTAGTGYTLKFTWQVNGGTSTYLGIVKVRCPF